MGYGFQQLMSGIMQGARTGNPFDVKSFYRNLPYLWMQRQIERSTGGGPVEAELPENSSPDVVSAIIKAWNQGR
jgi:hypothetical protein